ncbi:class F sortase [Cutibacterium sp. WCA-380-WT-3A]|uniref:Class F sortase n=1 Tax=Cutibacterium porci TaxID=2605781 RepID=A0A7K0J782_9ACTN|nr:class F sortase [Cutibacterium porci]MSS45807.1 class F sortase [Cutibacterium porci]
MVVIALVVAAVATIFIQRDNNSSASASGPASSAATATAPDASGTSSAVKAPVPAGCMKQPQPIIPVKYSIDHMNVSAKVLSRGVDSTGAAGAPPRDDPSSMAWFNQGPKVGSNKGNVVLTSHTFHIGEALGNKLYSKDDGLKPGDIIRLSDKSGNTVCYRYSHNTKVWVKDYDPNSTILYNDNGPAQAVIVVCWDYVKGKGHESRILFYADPVA